MLASRTPSSIQSRSAQLEGKYIANLCEFSWTEASISVFFQREKIHIGKRSRRVSTVSDRWPPLHSRTVDMYPSLAKC